MEEFDTSGEGAHAHWPDRFFAGIIDGFVRHTGNRGGRVGNAMTHVVNARALLDYADPVMKATALGKPSVDR